MANSPQKIKIAELDVGLSTLEQKIKQASQILNMEGLKNQIPQRLKQTFDELGKSLDKLYKTKPVSGANTKEINKYQQEINRLTNRLDTAFTTLSHLKIDSSGIQDSIQALKDLKKEWEEAKEAADNYKENIGSKGALDPNQLAGKLGASGKARGASAGYRELIERAERNAIAAARAGRTGDIRGAYSEIYSKLSERKELIADDDINQARAINEMLQLIEKRWQSLIGQATEFNNLTSTANQKEGLLNEATGKEIENIANELSKSAAATKEAEGEAEKLNEQYSKMGEESGKIEQASRSIDSFTNRLTYMFEATSIFMTVRRIVRDAIRDFQELDKEFNEIAIVSKYSTKEMWDSFSQVNKMAQEYGVTTKNILEVQNLYYHQGKDMAEVNKLTAQTLTLAKITGMDYADATNKLTAALNAYKLEAEDAVRVTDTVAALSANAATSSEELMTALTKTASIAANAGMSLENTEVFLTKMIETTREAPENLGTALKTIVARFGEVKNAIDENGEAIERADINKVDKALGTVGISLLDTAGQIRDLDDVFMELSSKWDDLDRNTQRYIATIAAGSRQQSRFIAMMENYDRTLELVDVAQNSAGTGSRQLAKAQESIETALNRLKSSWQELYSKVIKSGFIKGALNIANSFIEILNKLPGPLGSITLGFTVWLLKTKLIDKGLAELTRTLKLWTGGMEASAAMQDRINKAAQAERLTLSERTKRIKEYLALKKAENITNKNELAVKGKLISATKTKTITDNEGNKIEVIRKLTTKELAETELLESAALDKNSASKVTNDSLNKLLTTSYSKLVASVVATTLAITAQVAIIASIIVAIGALIVISIQANEVGKDTSKILDKITEKQEKYNESLEKLKTLRDAKKTLDDLNKSAYLTEEQTTQLQEATENLASTFPDLIAYYDEEGKAVLKENDIIQKRIDLLKDEAQQYQKDYITSRREYIQKGVLESTEKENAKTAANNYLLGLGISTGDTKQDAQALFHQMKGVNPADVAGSIGSALGSSIGSTMGPLGSILGTEVGTQLKENFENSPEFIQTASGEIAKLGSKVYSWFSLDDELIQKILEGQGLDIYDSQAAFGKKLTEEQYKAIQKAASGKQILNSSDLWDVLKETEMFDPEEAGKMADEFFTSIPAELAPSVLADLSSQFGHLKDALQTEIYNLLDINNYNIPNKDKNLLAQIFADWGNEKGKTGEELANIIQAIPTEQISSILGKLDMGAIKLSDYMGKDYSTNFDDFIKNTLGITDEKSDLYQAVLQYLSKNLEFSEEDLRLLANQLGIKIDTLLNYTAEQVKAEKKTINRLIDLTGDDNKARELYKNAQDALAGYPQAVKKANAATYDTAEGIRDLAKDFALLQVPADKGAEAIINLAGGIENLPQENAEDFLKSLTQGMEDFNNDLEALGRLRDGKGTIEDLAKAMNILTMGMEGAQIIETVSNIQKAITISAEGITLDYAMIGASTEALANQQLNYTDFMQLIYGQLEESAMNHAAEMIKAAYIEAGRINEVASLELTTLEGLKSAYDALTGEQQGYSGLKEAMDALGRVSYQKLMTDAFAKLGGAAKDAAKKSEDAAKKAADAAKRMQEAWQNFVDYLNNVDRYSNLDALLDRIKDNIDNLEFEISFSTNPKEIAKDLKAQSNEIQRQMAGNIAGKRGAERNLLARRNAIRSNSQTKGYLSFGADGNILINQQKMLALEEQIRDAKIKNDEVTLAVLEGQKKAIEDNAKAYNDELKAVQKYTKGVQDSLKATQEFNKKLYENVVELENKLIDVIQKKEDKELELTKKKYDAIKEEDNKYLDSVRKMIDKERALREQKNDEDAVRDKERKLAMMKMDTSGIYSSEIRALEKELKQDYQDLSDKAVDRMVDQLEEENNARAEAMDKDVYYTETTLERKRELMTDYYEEIKQLDTDLVTWFMNNDEEYLKASKAQKELLKQQYAELVGNGEASKEVLQDGSITSVQQAITLAQESATDLDNAIKLYGDNAKVTNGEVQTSISNLAGEYSSLVSIIAGNGNSLVSAYNSLRDAIEECAKKTKELNAEQAKTRLDNNGGNSYTPPKNNNIKTFYANGNTGNLIGNKKYYLLSNQKAESNTGESYYGVAFNTNAEKPIAWVKWKDVAGDLGNNNEIVGNIPLYTDKEIKKKTLIHGGNGGKFASGGLVDYTGPAWVDGSKAKPEAFLSAADTANIAKLRDILSIAFDPTAPTYPNSQSTSNATYNITIEVDSIASDYDVDQAVSHLQSKIQQASGYRNINILKKSK